MKKDHKLFLVPIGIGLLALAAILIDKPDSTPDQSPALQTTSKSPAENYPEDERQYWCGTVGPKSNTYIKEYEIPTPCTKPLGIILDKTGKVWFTETNTGNIGMFDPAAETFVEYENEAWPQGHDSMMWGMGYSDDNEIWFTDDNHDAIWKFSIEEKKFSSYKFPSGEKGALPQKFIINDQKFFINDFYSNKIVLIDHSDIDKGDLNYISIETPSDFFTGPPAISENGEIWFISWKFGGEAKLIKYVSTSQQATVFDLSEDLHAPNGLSMDDQNNLWITDTASSSFFKFNTDSEELTKYVTSSPRMSVFGNSSGAVKNPLSRPYWNLIDDGGKLWFNEQTANVLGVFDPNQETLVEYLVPSKNPNWADCGDIEDCGVAQVFGFTKSGQKVWFTEWVENNIGVLDTAIPLPVSVKIEPQQLELKSGEKSILSLTFYPIIEFEKEAFFTNSNSVDENVSISGIPQQVTLNELAPQTFSFEVSVAENTTSGTYKVLVGAKYPDVTVSQFFTVEVT